MRYLVCLFQAPVKDAAAIRSIVTTRARKWEEWPHLAITGVDGPDMNKLEKLARPKRPKGTSKLGGELLDRGKMSDTPFTAVSRVTTEFSQVLTALDEPGIEELGRAWSGVIDGVAEKAAIELVRTMAKFARKASKAGKPLLELVVM